MTYAQYKSKFAKLLATENITVEHVHGADTATFNLETRTLNLPVWSGVSSELYDMLLVHETGHAIDTPFEGWKSSIEGMAEQIFGKQDDDVKKHIAERKCHHYFNAIEDVRIDRLQRQRYPGSKKNYVIAHKELHDRDFFGLGTSGKPINEYSFIDRANIFYKGGDQMGINFTKEEQELLDKMYRTQTWDDVVSLVEEVFDFVMKSKSPDDDGDYGTRDDVFVTEGDYMQGLGGDGETMEFYERSLKQIIDNSPAGTKFAYANFPVPNLDRLVVPSIRVMEDARRFLNRMQSNSISTKSGMLPFKDYLARQTGLFNQWKADENSSISFMIKEFETLKAAAAYSKTQIAKTGALNMNKIHSYMYNEDLFKRNTIVPQGKNHGFVFFIDWSSSMNDYIHETLKQMYSIILFCRRLGIPFDVYNFTSGTVMASGQFLPKDGDITFGESISCRHILSSSMNTLELNEMMLFFWLLTANTGSVLAQDASYRMNGTPLNAIIIAATEIVKRFQKKHRVEIMNAVFLTDGESNPISGIYNKKVNLSEIGRMYIRDPETSNVFKVEADDNNTKEHFWSGYSRFQIGLTESFYSYLKFKTGCNVIGFHLLNGTAYDVVTAYVNKPERGDKEKCKTLWSSEGFMPVLNAGMDEKYMVSIERMSKKVSDLTINRTDPKAKQDGQFHEHMKSRRLKRVLLRRFIGRISAQII